MKIWVTRHGQTRYNAAKLMQGRTDEPLNETGLLQAEEMRRRIGEVHFDAVYASPLKRAVRTASIIGGVPEADVITDSRLTETEFGKYELKKYTRLGPRMTLYWVLPEIFHAPESVETIAAMRKRCASFFSELEEKKYENVLISCHGGVMRVISGYLSGRKNGIMWRPKPHNCEVRVFSREDGKRTLLKICRLPKTDRKRRKQ